MPKLAQQSNPFSTGGGGSNFETRIQTAFTVLMLANQSAPCLPNYPITKLKLQARYDEVHTDDLVVIAQNYQTDEKARLFAQIKHDIALTARDDTFSDVIGSAWEDFSNDNFCIDQDAIALITAPLSKIDINHVRPFLEWARHCDNEVEFFQKINTEKFTSKQKQEKLDAFKVQLKKANNDIDLNDKQLWEFLKSFHVISYDFDTASGSNLTQIKAFISQCTNQPPDPIWSQLLNAVQLSNQNAGTITQNTLPRDIQEKFDDVNIDGWRFDEQRLKAHSNTILDRIQTTIGKVHINQADSLIDLLNATSSSDFIIVTGERGSGKSSLVKSFISQTDKNAVIFYFSLEDLDHAHLDQVFSSMNLQGTIDSLASRLTLVPQKFLILESLEKLLELAHTAAFVDLLHFIKKSGDWKIIASCRDYATQQIIFHYLSEHSIPHEILQLNGFSDEQLQELENSLSSLRPVLKNPNLKSLVRIPFFTKLAFKTLKTVTNISSDIGEQEFRNIIWNTIIADERNRANGMPAKREQVFIDIAIKRAKQMTYGIPEDFFDSEVVYKLEEDNIIYRDTNRKWLVPAHDILEDWAIAAYIEKVYQLNTNNVCQFTEDVGNEPAITRSYRLWLHQKISYQNEIHDFIYKILIDNNIQSFWKDETIAAILNSDTPDRFLDSLSTQLFEHDFELLKRFCFVLRIACQIPHPDFSLKGSSSDDVINTLVLIPNGQGWKSIISFLQKNKEQLPFTITPHIVRLLNDWSSLLAIHKSLPEESRDAGLLALHLLEPLKESYRDNEEGNRKTLQSIIIKVAPTIEKEFLELFEKDVFIARSGSRRPERLSYVESFCKQSFSLIESGYFARYFPKLLIRLANYEWFIPEETNFEPDPWFSSSHSGSGTAKFFNLHEHRYEFFPASGLKGSFHYLLRYHTQIGLDFILHTLNQSVEKYVHSNLDTNYNSYSDRLDLSQPQIDSISIQLNNGSTTKQYLSERLWLAYRGHSVVPYLLQCSLMALENWLIDIVKNSNTDKVEQIFTYILKNSNSVMSTAVLTAVSTGYPHKVGQAAFPLLRQYELYQLDLRRLISERGANETNWFRAGLQEEFTTLYEEERRKAALHTWRKQSLETLVINFQLIDEFRDTTLKIIDSLKANSPSSENIRFLLHRIDSRGWETKLNKENNQITFEASQLEDDLQEIQQDNKVERQETDRFTSLYLWSNQRLLEEKSGNKYFTSWQEALSEAKSLLSILESEEAQVNQLMQSTAGSIAKSATIFIRDHGDKLTEENIEWCLNLIIPTVIKNTDAEDHITTTDIADHDGAAACANVLPILFDYYLHEDDRKALRKIIILSLTHNNENVRHSAAIGIREYLWARDPKFAEICIIGAIEYARFDKQEFRDEYRHSYYAKDRQTTRAKLQKQKDAFRQKFLLSQINTTKQTISLDTHSAWHILSPFLMIPTASRKVEHIEYYLNILEVFYTGEQEGFSDRDAMHHLNYKVSSEFSKQFAQHLFALQESDFSDYIDILNKGCDIAPDFIKRLELIFAIKAENDQQEAIYWKLWGKLSQSIKTIAIDTAHQERTRFHSDKRITLLRSFLKADTPWQKTDEDIRLVKSGKQQLIDFCNDTSMNPDVFEALAKLMHYFPKTFFDQGLHILAQYQKAETNLRLLSGNTSFYLERSIQRFLQHDQTGALPQKVHTSCLVLLNAVVETGSARAYSLREHLIRSRRIV